MSLGAAPFPPGAVKCLWEKEMSAWLLSVQTKPEHTVFWSHQGDVPIAEQGSAGAQQRPGEPWAGVQADL